MTLKSGIPCESFSVYQILLRKNLNIFLSQEVLNTAYKIVVLALKEAVLDLKGNIWFGVKHLFSTVPKWVNRKIYF